MLTAPDQGIRDEPTTPLGSSDLIATLGRLSRLLTALEDVAYYGGPTMVGQSWSRISDLLRETERLAHAGARQPTARLDHPSAVRIAHHVAAITDAARATDEHTVGCARWWLAVHTLSQRAEEAHRLLAGRSAEHVQGARETA